MRNYFNGVMVGVAALTLTFGGAVTALGTSAQAAPTGAESLSSSSLPVATQIRQSGLKQVGAKDLAQLMGAKGVVSPAASYSFRRVTNQWGYQCLDGDRGGIPRNGAKAQLWGCNGWDNQAWTLVQVSGMPIGYYYIQNGYGGQCLDGDRGQIPNNGARAQLWGCNGWTNQMWRWTGSRFVNYYGGQCLDGDRGQIPNNGARVQLWACNGWSNQGWTLGN
jgi:hypothetical protein